MVALFLAGSTQECGEPSTATPVSHPLLFWRAEGCVEFLEVGGPMLGGISGAAFPSGRVVLGRGDALISYSDGIVECRNHQGEEFGAERLVAASQNAGHLPQPTCLYPCSVLPKIFAGTHAREDDLTLM